MNTSDVADPIALLLAEMAAAEDDKIVAVVSGCGEAGRIEQAANPAEVEGRTVVVVAEQRFFIDWLSSEHCQIAGSVPVKPALSVMLRILPKISINSIGGRSSNFSSGGAIGMLSSSDSFIHICC